MGFPSLALRTGAGPLSERVRSTQELFPGFWRRLVHQSALQHIKLGGVPNAGQLAEQTIYVSIYIADFLVVCHPFANLVRTEKWPHCDKMKEWSAKPGYPKMQITKGKSQGE